MPDVVGDQRYAELNEWSGGSAESRADYEQALQAALESALDGKPHPAARQQPKPKAPAALAPAPPPNPTALVDAPTAVVGDQVIVRRKAWPRASCTEHGGSGWSATVRSRTSHTAVVRFTSAHTADGRAYEDTRLPRHFLAQQAPGA